MEVQMELNKKTTILFSPDSHRRLSDLAARRGVSLGQLVREACAVTYGITDQDTRISAVDALTALSLPVDTVAAMKRQSVPDSDALV